MQRVLMIRFKKYNMQKNCRKGTSHEQVIIYHLSSFIIGAKA